MAAIPTPPVNNPNPFAQQLGNRLPPPGTYAAQIVDIVDQFGVERNKYQSEERERVDLACFLFQFSDSHGQPHRAATGTMRISGHPNAALFQFLRGILGRPPQIGWDYMTLKGMWAIITVEHIRRQDGSGYASITSVAPMPTGGQPLGPMTPTFNHPPQAPLAGGGTGQAPWQGQPTSQGSPAFAGPPQGPWQAAQGNPQAAQFTPQVQVAPPLGGNPQGFAPVPYNPPQGAWVAPQPPQPPAPAPQPGPPGNPPQAFQPQLPLAPAVSNTPDDIPF